MLTRNKSEVIKLSAITFTIVMMGVFKFLHSAFRRYSDMPKLCPERAISESIYCDLKFAISNLTTKWKIFYIAR